MVTPAKLNISQNIAGHTLVQTFGAGNVTLDFTTYQNFILTLNELKPYLKFSISNNLIDKSAKYLTTNQFLEAIDSNLKKKLN